MHKFTPAAEGEATVFGASRPGYSSNDVPADAVVEWISFMRRNGIKRVCCLLPPDQLTHYRTNLLNMYMEEFGEDRVCHAPIKDYHLSSATNLRRKIIPFLEASVAAGEPVVVHCSGGSGRTGHVLAAWLIRSRACSPGEAISLVETTGRNPREAVQCGNATESELVELLASATLDGA